MSSIVEICNLALGNIRAASINSIDEQTVVGQQCKLRYPFVKSKMLTDYHWSFASSIEGLELLNESVSGWLFVYSYPNKALKIDRVFSSVTTGCAVEYRVLTKGNKKVIVSNTSNLSADCRFDVDDTTLFSDGFILALSHLLGAELAQPLMGGKMASDIRAESMRMYNEYVNMALSNDTSESYTEDTSDFLTVRGLYAGTEQA